jgi:hypothetical protein
MVITFQGLESFKITQGDLSISINPLNSRVSSDITLITSSAFAGEGKGFIVSGPGEYEIKDVGVKGFLSETTYKGKSINTIYQVSFEGMKLAFLGALSNSTLSPEAFESLEDIDILFVPIGGEGVLDPASAYKLAVSLEPGIIIPTHYDAKSLKQFLKEGGDENISAVDKLVIKKKDLEGKEGDIVVLKEE